LDAYRHFIEDSFDFSIQIIGMYDHQTIVKKACIVLQNKFLELIKSIDSNTILIKPSETTIDHAFDIILENEDYTIGKVLEYILYEKYYITEKTLTYCGFKKFHPHDTTSTVRIAFASVSDKHMAGQYLRTVCVEASQLFTDIFKLF
jgi:DNA-directed RNA polymerase subunit L